MDCIILYSLASCLTDESTISVAWFLAIFKQFWREPWQTLHIFHPNVDELTPKMRVNFDLNVHRFVKKFEQVWSVIG